MTARIGPGQLRFLIMCGSPTILGFVTDRASRALLRRELIAPVAEGSGMVRITAAGLRALADAMEDGRVDATLKEMKADLESRRKQLAKAQRRSSLAGTKWLARTEGR